MENRKIESPYMMVSEAAEYLSISATTLNRYRCQQIGPRYAKLGGCVRYTKVDLDEWVKDNLVFPDCTDEK